ncbi:MAG: hypothetical protein ACI4IS_00530 [Acutalibacteraceae bacterium]
MLYKSFLYVSSAEKIYSLCRIIPSVGKADSFLHVRKPIRTHLFKHIKRRN